MISEIEKIIRSARRKAINQIRKNFEPHMWESGYRIGKIGESRPLKLWANKDKNGEFQSVVLNGKTLEDFDGIAESGVIVDSFAGACVIEPLKSFPLEDLLLLVKWSEKNLPKKQLAA